MLSERMQCEMGSVLYLVVTVVAAVLGQLPPDAYRNAGHRIIGGMDADINDFAYLASVMWRGSHICGGSIVAPKWCLTAAHCAPPRFTTSEMSLHVGSSYRTSGGAIYGVRQIILHPDYNETTANYDFCLLRTTTMIVYGPNVQPITMAESDYVIVDGIWATISGFGKTNENGTASDRLQTVSIPVWSQKDCRLVYGAPTITNQMFCAGLIGGGKDSCQGDSGGPCVANGVLFGVVSWGRGCARPDLPGVYARVSSVRPWIDAVINSTLLTRQALHVKDTTKPSKHNKKSKPTARNQNARALESVSGDADTPEAEARSVCGAASVKAGGQDPRTADDHDIINTVLYYNKGTDSEAIVNVTSNVPWSVYVLYR